MIRQEENNRVKRFLNSKEAQAYLTISRRAMESAVKDGEIGYKKINGRYYFPVEELERWARNLNYHTDYINEVRRTGRISQSLTKPEQGIGLEKLRELRNLEKQKSTASRGLQAYSNKASLKPQVSCLA